ncbi:hypothetical protein D1P53_005649 [Cryptococcus gattii VGV]|nr:hypothetical protein D1P53_005649 [Cryptococcus gattii VGV]
MNPPLTSYRQPFGSIEHNAPVPSSPQITGRTISTSTEDKENIPPQPVFRTRNRQEKRINPQEADFVCLETEASVPLKIERKKKHIANIKRKPVPPIYKGEKNDSITSASSSAPSSSTLNTASNPSAANSSTPSLLTVAPQNELEIIQSSGSTVFPHRTVSIPSSINHNLSSVTSLPVSCSETTHASILDGSMFSSDNEMYEDNVPARDALPGGLDSGLVNESIQSLDAMIEQQDQESGVTRETRTSLDAEANNSDQSKESDFDNQESQHQFNSTSRPVLSQPHNPSVLPGCCSFKPSVYSGTDINEQATVLTSEESEDNERSATESDTRSNDKVLFATPAYQFDHLRWSQEQPLKVNGIVEGDETVKDDPSYPTSGCDNPNFTALTSKQATAIIHEITTQLATQLASHSPKTNTAGFFHLPSQSFAQALNPGNSSPVPSFYADSHHLASSILFPSSRHQNAISRNSDELRLAERYAQRDHFSLEGDRVLHNDDDYPTADTRFEDANSNSDMGSGRPHQRIKERLLLVCLVTGVRGWREEILGLDDDLNSQQSDLNGFQTDAAPGNNRNNYSDVNNDARTIRPDPSDEPELDLWTPQTNLTASAANVASLPTQYRPFTSMPSLLLSIPPIAIIRNSISSPNLLGLYEPRSVMHFRERGTLEPSTLAIPLPSSTFTGTSATPSPTPTLANPSPTIFNRHRNLVYRHHLTPYPTTISGSSLAYVPDGLGGSIVPIHHFYHPSTNGLPSTMFAPPSPTRRPSFVSSTAWVLDRSVSTRIDYRNGKRNIGRFLKGSLARKKMTFWLPWAHPHPLVRANRWMATFTFLLGWLVAILFMLMGIKSKMNQRRMGVAEP